MILHAQQVEPHHKLWTKEEYYRLGDLGFFRGQKVELMEGDIIIQYPEDHKGDGVHYPSDAPHSRLWTKDEYYRLGELGFFDGMKAELLEGEIVVTSPQKWPHYSELDRVAEVLRWALQGGVWVRTQAPLDLGLVIEPEPDVSVVKGCREDYTAHPTTALLVVEVSETTLAYDREDKASLFAKGKIDDYWVVNLIDCQLEVYRTPAPDASRAHGYGDVTILRRGDSVSLLAFPGIAIQVDDLLP
jgi:Uma2 family endonuclease